MQPPPLCSLCSWPPEPRMRPLQSRSTKTPPERSRPHSRVPRVRWRRASCTCPCTSSRGLRAASSCNEALGSPCSRATAARRTGNTASSRPRASATRCRARSNSCRRHPNTAYSSFRPAPTQARNCPAPRARRSTASRPDDDYDAVQASPSGPSGAVQPGPVGFATPTLPPDLGLPPRCSGPARKASRARVHLLAMPGSELWSSRPRKRGRRRTRRNT
mmetsp:Transcript_45000/g.144199  ORF Transcript_45000/g.144199 Transcript_45000/m.144199 type:complete len:218 (-) Transcript_45000:989-1642(-)